MYKVVRFVHNATSLYGESIHMTIRATQSINKTCSSQCEPQLRWKPALVCWCMHIRTLLLTIDREHAGRVPVASVHKDLLLQSNLEPGILTVTRQ
jgi:hypothetical protein